MAIMHFANHRESARLQDVGAQPEIHMKREFDLTPGEWPENLLWVFKNLTAGKKPRLQMVMTADGARTKRRPGSLLNCLSGVMVMSDADFEALVSLTSPIRLFDVTPLGLKVSFYGAPAATSTTFDDNGTRHVVDISLVNHSA